MRHKLVIKYNAKYKKMYLFRSCMREKNGFAIKVRLIDLWIVTRD